MTMRCEQAWFDHTFLLLRPLADFASKIYSKGRHGDLWNLDGKSKRMGWVRIGQQALNPVKTSISYPLWH